jgi:hypothetical protein
MRIRSHLLEDEDSVISDVLRVVRGKPLRNSQVQQDEPPIVFDDRQLRRNTLLDDVEAWLHDEATQFPNLVSARLIALAEYVNPF